ncbi:GNAT family N-acetyltransferase [Cytophaga aurantiaca]|uniref:GNAT family N-acetyltransferase n=1 Tax=Cytophaga aurantiaca TaxID=29530 RepID=UPI00037796C8|nr:GNAT family N-acetyltransferase [Cytophaga aurantiaca]
MLFRLLTKEDVIPYELLLDADPSKKLVDLYMSKGDTYIAVQDNTTIGVCVLVAINTDTTEIKNLAVAEALQGKGIGTKIIQHVFELANNKGYKTILVATSTPNIGPLYLYQKMGFEFDYIIKHFVDTHYDEPLYDNGIRCNHMIVLSKKVV